MARRRCPVCGSKQWHKEPSSGLIACSEGHVLQNYRNEASEADEVGPHMMLKRTLKSGRKKRGKQSKADPKLYHGPRGRYHYFQCLQLLLRHQITALIKLWDLPPEFEIICRDIWALHLSLLPVPPPPEPYFHVQASKNDQEPKAPDQDAEQESDQEAQDQTASSSASSSEDEETLDPLPSSSSTSEEGAGVGSPPKTKSKTRGKRGHFAYETPESCVSVLVLGCWTMRIPIFLKDVVRLIESYELPYLDPIRFLPADMTLHLTKHNRQSLSPYHSPSVMSLHALSSRLAKLMYASYGIFTPEANAAPILWRLVRELGGTPTLYMLTKRLGQALSLPLTLHITLAPSLERRKKRDPGSHKYDNVPPEAALTATAIVVLKMVYGLDGDSRVPMGEECGMPRIKEWLELVKKIEEKEGRSNGALFDARGDMCVGELDEGQMDEYLRLCERGLLGGENERGEVLERYFPLVGARQGEGDRPTIVATACSGHDVLKRGEGIVGMKDICRIVNNFQSRIVSL